MRTLGVEEEFLLVDASSGALRAAGGDVAASADQASDGQFEPELKREQVELGTAPHESTDALESQLRARRRELAGAAAEHDARLAALATAPADVTATSADGERYRRIHSAYGAIASMQLTCGMHVHVSVDDSDEGVRVLDAVRPWLPVFVALAANSPFWSGEDTGYDGFRTVLWGEWPTAGPTEPFGSAAEYERVRAALVASGTALDEGMIYFDARLSARYPTVEFRVADVCPRVEDAVTLAALFRALVGTAASGGLGGAADVRTEFLRAATWRAARWGMTGELVDPDAGDLGLAPAWTVVQHLLDHLRGELDATADKALVDAGLSAIRTRGTGAQLQRAAFARRGEWGDVVADVVERTNA